MLSHVYLSSAPATPSTRRAFFYLERIKEHNNGFVDYLMQENVLETVWTLYLVPLAKTLNDLPEWLPFRNLDALLNFSMFWL